MKRKDMKAKDVLLTLLYLSGKTNQKNEPIIGRTRITKMMFLFEKELFNKFDNINQTSLPQFFAFDYGPFSKDLLDDLRFFNSIGFIQEVSTGFDVSEPEANEYLKDLEEDIGYGESIELYNVGGVPKEFSYSLTEKGIKYVEEKIIDNFELGQIELLIKFKSRINSISLDALLSYVYNKYPDSAEKSKIKEKYLNC